MEHKILENQNSGADSSEVSKLFTKLPLSNSPISRKKLRIAIVTPEIVGPSHGGVGTAYHALACALAEDGNQVTILYVPYEPPLEKKFSEWRKNYEKLNIRLELLTKSPIVEYDSLWANAKRSYQVMQWLQSQEIFDFVHFPDGKGLGYYAIQAKYQGLLFLKTNFVVGAHSTTYWDASFSFGEKTYYQDYLERAFLESETARLVDFLISPSQFHLEWMKNQACWTLSRNSYFQPNIMAGSSSIRELARLGVQEKKTEIPVRELVFFGRLERRKGLILLCDALDQPNIRNRTDFSLTLMGHPAYINGKSALEYIKERSVKWKFSWEIIPRKERDEALLYVKKPWRIALIPSLSETMSYTVLECLWVGIPFLAARTGGIPELIHPADLKRVTFEPTAKAFASSLEHVLEKGADIASPSFNIEENGKHWVDWHQQSIPTSKLEIPTSSEYLSVSVCIIIDHSEKISHEFIECLQNQNYPNLERILIFTGSNNNDNLLKIDGFSCFNLASSDSAEAYNFAAEMAKGFCLFFLDKDLLLVSNSLATMMSVFRKTNADIVSFAVSTNESGSQEPINSKARMKEKIQFHLGNSLSLGALHNVFGGRSFLVRSDVFNKLDGFSTGKSNVDFFWDFYSKACLNLYRIESIPIPLGKLVKLETSDNQIGQFVYDHNYLKDIPPKFHELFHFIQASRFFHDPAPDGTFEEGFVNRPQAFVDKYWNSRMWKFYLPWGNKIRKFFNLPEYEYPRVRTLTEALRGINKVNESLFWNIIFPILKMRRKYKKN